MKRVFSLALVFAVLLTCTPFPSFSAKNSHTRLAHLNSTNIIKTDVAIDPISNLDRLFDGDSSASHADTRPAEEPDGNGFFGKTWRSAGETGYIIIDLGDVYELSQINTYWGWAPEAKPDWNRWKFNAPSSYKIYVSDTEEGLFNAEPVAEVTGITEGENGLADSFASVSAVGRYVKIVSVYTAGHYSLREIEFFGTLSPRTTPLGANIRLEEDGLSAGLRFGAKIEKAVLGIEGEWSYDPNSDFEFGMFLLPANKLEAGETLEEYLKSGGNNALKIVAKKILSQDDSTITYTAVLTGIPESAYNQSIVAVPYSTKNGVTTYYDDLSKSYAGVAKSAMESYQNGNPMGISSSQYNSLKPIAESYVEPIGYYDVDAAAKKLGLDYINATLPASVFIDIGTKYLGYKIDGTYKVDADTLRKLAETPCIGDGTIRWKDCQDVGSWTGNPEQPEYAPVDLLNDPVYMSMLLPSERNCYMESRINAAFMDVAEDSWYNVMTIGAVYKNADVEIPDDAEFTLCISNINLAVRTTKSDGWYEAVNIPVPTMYNQMYYLPWQLEGELGTHKLKDRITYYDDHVEIKLTGADFNATEAKKVSDEVEQCVYHYWGKKHYFDCKGSEVLGVACSYKVWVKEPEASEYLVAAIGADWRDADENALQAFAGYKYAVTTTPTQLVGHNVELSRYRDVMDTEKVQQILNIK